MKIGFFEIEPWQKALFRNAFPKDQLYFSEEKLNSRDAAKYRHLEAVSVFIYSRISEKVLEKMPHLKFIATRSTGFDHIDLEACKKRGIKVGNVPAYGENTVAEHAFALMVSLSRKIVDCVERTRNGKFSLAGLRGFDLRGKTLGVVGTGNIGKVMTCIGRGLGMDIVGYDIIKDQKFARQTGMKYVSLEKLFQISDIVSIHVPYNRHTHHLINKKLFSQVKKGSYFINTARGGVVDTFALLQSLKSEKLAGAGLDVLEEEDAMVEEAAGKKGEHWKCADKKIIAANHQLMKMRNVFITPHNAFNTKEAIMRILGTTIDNIKGFKRKKCLNLVC